MEKVEACYFLEDVTGENRESLGSAEVCYIPRIGGTIFLQEDGWDFKTRKKTGYKIDGEYIVKDIHQVVHNNVTKMLDGEAVGLPTWKTKERIEIIVTEIKDYTK